MLNSSTPLQNLTLFVSYSRSDLPQIAGLREILERQGARVWIDRANMALGVSVRQQIEAALHHSDAVLFIATPSSIGSFWCAIELGIALGLQKTVFPILHGIEYSSLPAVLSDLSGCAMSDVASLLLPAIARLRPGITLQLLDADVLSAEIEPVVARIASQHLQAEMISVLMDALSMDKGVRRIGHIRIRRMPGRIRAEYLDVLDELVGSQVDHIRGEAYYCLGQIPDRRRGWRHDVGFFVHGLYDASDKVKSCCANVIRNFVPLPEEAVGRLHQFIALGSEQMPLYSDRSGMVYWAHMSLDAHFRALKRK